MLHIRHSACRQAVLHTLLHLRAQNTSPEHPRLHHCSDGRVDVQILHCTLALSIVVCLKAMLDVTTDKPSAPVIGRES